MTRLVCGLLLGAAGSVLSQEEIPPADDFPAEAALQETEDRASRMRFFEAIARGDLPAVEELLAGGLDPNSCVPSPVEPGFVKGFADGRLRYYLVKERGLTGLMMAAALGHQDIVRSLLAAGADPYRMTKRHRTYALWLAAQYGNIEIMRCLMGIGPDHESMAYRIEVDLAAQKAWLWHGRRIVLSAPISSGRKSHPTPTGRYLVTDKYRMWKSTLYDAKMPYFLRLSCGDFGLHQGVLPGRPASHGCIRLPGKEAKELFATVPVGTVVEIR